MDGSVLHSRSRSLVALLLISVLLVLSGSFALASAKPVSHTAPAFTCADVSQIPQSECTALIALYNSTDGPHWTNNSGWLQNNTPCAWYGVVTCVNGRIAVLGLSHNNLRGSIPEEIGNISNLDGLYLDDNSLSGSLPSSIGNLIHLTTFALSQNQLTGQIPDSLVLQRDFEKVCCIW